MGLHDLQKNVQRFICKGLGRKEFLPDDLNQDALVTEWRGGKC